MGSELQHRMKSIRQTIQITGAQKLVAAAHIGKAKAMLAQSKPYHDKIIVAIADVIRHCPEAVSRYLKNGDPVGGKRGLLVLSANRGLTGGFNSNIIHYTENFLQKKPAVYLIVLGRACRLRLMQNGYPVDETVDEPLDPPAMHTARMLAEKISGMLESGQVDSFDIIYTEYKSSVRMKPALTSLFPLSPSVFQGFGKDMSEYLFEPDPGRLLDSMILKYLKGYIYGCLVNTYICELTSRLTAMDSAIRNANEMLEKLTLAYNRARQAAITQEITEIVAGAAALEGNT